MNHPFGRYRIAICGAALALSACASAPRPAALTEAQERLRGPVAVELDGVEPRLLARARDHAADGERAYRNGAIDKAELHGRLAQQQLDVAIHSSGRDQANRLTEVVAASQVVAGPDEVAASPGVPSAEPTPTAAAVTPASAPTDDGPAEIVVAPVPSPMSSGRASSVDDLAADAVFASQVRRAEALGDLVDQTCPGDFREFSALVDLAAEQLDRNRPALAFEYAIRASERLDACTDRLTPTPVPAAKASRGAATKAPVTEPTATKAPSKASVEATLVAAQAARDKIELDPSRRQDPRVTQGDLLVESSREALTAKDFVTAAAVGERAKGLFDTVLAESPKVRGDCDAAERLLGETEARVPSERAIAALEGEPRRQVARAKEVLARARTAKEALECDRAGALAEDAAIALDGLPAATAADPTAATAADPTAVASTATATPSQDGPSDRVATSDGESASNGERRALERIAAARAASEQVVDAAGSQVFLTGNGLLRQSLAEFDARRWDTASELADQARFAFESLSRERTPTAGTETLDPAWRGAYAVVVEALAAREEAHRVVEPGSEDAPRLAAADAMVEQSRAEWHRSQFLASESTAAAATLAYRELVGEAEARLSASELAELEAVREAERAALQLEAAETARLDTERENLRVRAQDAMRALEVAIAGCELAGCASRDPVEWTRIRGLQSDAETELARENYERVGTLAEDGRAAASALAAAAPAAFAVPASVSRVSRVGDQLRLTPKLRFVSGKDVLVDDSLVSLTDLADTLVANVGTLRSVRIVGHTDNRGSERKNQTISAERADKLRALLIERGVPASVIITEGRGESEPIADNSTSDGRETNRRVEIYIETL